MKCKTQLTEHEIVNMIRRNFRPTFLVPIHGMSLTPYILQGKSFTLSPAGASADLYSLLVLKAIRGLLKLPHELCPISGRCFLWASLITNPYTIPPRNDLTFIGVPGLGGALLPNPNFGFLSAGFNIWKEHIRDSSTLIIAPALSNSPQ